MENKSKKWIIILGILLTISVAGLIVQRIEYKKLQFQLLVHGRDAYSKIKAVQKEGYTFKDTLKPEEMKKALEAKEWNNDNVLYRLEKINPEDVIETKEEDKH